MIFKVHLELWNSGSSQKKKEKKEEEEEEEEEEKNFGILDFIIKNKMRC